MDLYLVSVFYVELCGLNLIITKGTLHPLILEHPEVTFCTIQLVFILYAIWKQASVFIRLFCVFSIVILSCLLKEVLQDASLSNPGL